MPRFSKVFGLAKTQSELDFVDVEITGDMPLFVDPFAISQRVDRWSVDAHHAVVSFFERVLEDVRAKRTNEAIELLSFLREPNETRLGLSKKQPRGAGIGSLQAEQLYDALAKSSAVKTGFIRSLEECELMIEGIGRDKISDLTTNIIRRHLAQYTKDQCDLHAIPTKQAPLPPYYAEQTSSWKSSYFDLPVTKTGPVLLVPKSIARYDPAYEAGRYYRHFVLEFLKAEHLAADTSLVRTLRNGKRVVYKRDLEKVFPFTKENLFKFSKDHPEVLVGYRAFMSDLERKGRTAAVTDEDEPQIAHALIEALRTVPGGSADASTYHSLMIGILEFISFPALVHPRKEQEIHEGRKRIDIVFENGAHDGVFWRLHQVKKLPSAFVVVECKNYTTEVANPELDQISSRFSVNRGQIGFLCCRNFENRDLFVQRCRDTFIDGRGLVIPVDDDTIIEWLALIASGKRRELEHAFTTALNEIWLN